jgi:XRE family transcriptional regulator, fatty acid utilization regulator
VQTVAAAALGPPSIPGGINVEALPIGRVMPAARSRDNECAVWTARAVFDQPDWTRPYQQYTDTPGGTYWCTAVAGAGDHEPLAVAVGTPYEHVKWLRGRGTANRSTSECPDQHCCTLPPSRLANRWSATIWPSARVHSAVLASLPAGAFPGVDQTEVLKFIERHQGENR